MAVHGIDVSAWQGDIDWAKAKASGKVGYAILKTGGSDAGLYKDSKFERNYKACKQLGIKVGAYYFVGRNCTTVEAGIADAKRFLEHLKGKQFEYPVYIDLEAPLPSTRKGNTDATVAFIQTVQNAGYWVGVYASTYSGFRDRLDDSRLQSYAHWAAQYGDACEYTGKVGTGMWQYTSSCSVAGIDGRVDANWCYVDYPTKIKAKGLNGFPKTATGSSTGSTTKPKQTTTPTTKPVQASVEDAQRAKMVALAESYLGCVRGDSKHKEIVDVFNTVQPDGWPMNYTAAWCATFVSALAIKMFGKEKAKTYFPLSANCYNIIYRSKDKGIWVESDSYVPSPGDWIIYDWDDNGVGEDATGYDHVGIVKSVANGKITVIEGNRNDKCATRVINVNGRYIRGFVHPKYGTLAGATTTTPVKPKTAVPTTTTVTKIKVDGDWGKQTTTALRKKLGINNATEKKEADSVIKNQLNSCKKYLKAVNATGWKFAENPKDNSPTIAALQKKISVTADGYIGEKTVKALQRFLNAQIKAGLDIDGLMGKKTVTALQKWING